MKMKTAKRPVKSGGLTTSETPKKLVRLAGLEPARVAPLPPQSSVSANSTIGALGAHNEPSPAALRKGNIAFRSAGYGCFAVPGFSRVSPLRSSLFGLLASSTRLAPSFCPYTSSSQMSSGPFGAQEFRLCPAHPQSSKAQHIVSFGQTGAGVVRHQRAME